jgi:mono/diheme cytochrome c family protein
MLAQTNIAGALLLVLGAVLVAISAGALYLRGRSRGKAIEIPGALQPGPSDGALETPLLHKLQGWGVVLVAFFVVWFPATWLFEPGTNLNQERALLEESVERGSRAVLPFSEENQLGVGCVNCHGPELRGGLIQAGETFANPPNLTDICAGNLGEHAAIASPDDIRQVIMEGREGTPMPSWSIRFQGALNDQQIQDLVNYLIDLSSENVPPEDNVCLNEKAQERALTAANEAGTVLEQP